LVHTPVHASWLSQIEVYFSIVQRKLLTPSDFESFADLKQNAMAFPARYQHAAKPFTWTFTRRDLHVLPAKPKKRALQPTGYVTVITTRGTKAQGLPCNHRAGTALSARQIGHPRRLSA
jgi:hypothetical protein